LVIAIPLTRLTRKDLPWNFTEQCQSAFNALKQAFRCAPVLAHFIPNHQIMVETDASDYAMAGVISIEHAKHEYKPIVFYSRTLTAPKLNYDTHNKELLAIFEAFRQW
jgi:hypothetical protein